MNVVVMGAGTVGTSIAKILCENQHDVRLIDPSREALDHSGESLDVQAVVGSGCDAVTLFQADILNADLCLAVTSHDEINLVGASLAKSMGAKRSVARIFNPTYRDFSTFDYQRHFGIDRLLSLEYLTALELGKAIRSTGMFSIENFARGGIEVQEVVVQDGAKAVDTPMRQLDLPKQVRVGLVASGARTFIPTADDALAVGDHVTLIGTRDAIDSVLKKFERKRPPRLNVTIVGGGEIGFNLASTLQGERFNILLMETDPERCEFLSQRLKDVTVLHADATRTSEMEEARVGNADVFVAATGRDEDNIVCGVEARELGTSRILSVVRRPDYANVLEKLGIDVAVSPRQVMARQVLGMVAGGAIVGLTEIADGQAIIWEIEVMPDAPITKAPLKDLQIGRALVTAIVREGYAWVPGADDKLKEGDTAVVILQKDAEKATQQLFLTPES